MDDINAQVFTAEQVCQSAQSTYEQTEEEYSTLTTQSKTFQYDPVGSGIMINEPNIPENIAVNEHNF